MNYQTARGTFCRTMAAFAVGVLPATLATSSFAQGNSYPDRPIRLIVPYAPGGPTDILARIIARGMSQNLGQPIVVENKAGAAGNIAYQGVATAPADGYTLVVVDIPFVTNAFLYQKPGYDAVRDFAPVGMIGYAPVALVTGTRGGPATVSGLIAKAKTADGKLTYGSAGVGSPPHLFMELFAQHAGVRLTHVPYKGASNALVDLAAGTIDTMFVGVSAARPLIASGAIQPLAVTGAQRMHALPSVSTLAETGFPEEGLRFGPWWAIAGPAGLPANAIAKLNAAVRAAASTPTAIETFQEMGIVRDTGSPEQLATFLGQDRERWKRVIQSAGIKNE
ncbi:MAG: tripartite tricarboxylate transporter substrate binding protein [Alcaligenaceae bacterium]|nr:tripartite tricarboxylate transporter substrate binding protein [Alcaligenaceae bacterium SAGV5]MPS50799.1 tripartite tricarboxylate transporter substrate binding protein [Alcaligenaceae bacterium SAGV3]MPT56703.1 tripartite tricarboxylate transporter substrate binding protein [Alcaligenaceae bacterium]